MTKIMHKPNANVLRILATVSRITDIPISEIRGSKRSITVVNARRIAMVLINDKLRYTLVKNAAMFHKDHATALHAFKKHSDLYEFDKDYAELFDICSTACGIDKMGDKKSKREVIAHLVLRVDDLELENRELREQLEQIKELAI